jgi:hypothetical protein
VTQACATPKKLMPTLREGTRDEVSHMGFPYTMVHCDVFNGSDIGGSATPRIGF